MTPVQRRDRYVTTPTTRERKKTIVKREGGTGDTCDYKHRVNRDPTPPRRHSSWPVSTGRRSRPGVPLKSVWWIGETRSHKNVFLLRHCRGFPPILIKFIEYILRVTCSPQDGSLPELLKLIIILKFRTDNYASLFVYFSSGVPWRKLRQPRTTPRSTPSSRPLLAHGPRSDGRGTG